MDWSRVVPLVVAVFAILILGVAAGSLDVVVPAETRDTDSKAVPGGSGSGEGATDLERPQPSERAIDHPLFSNLDFDSEVDDRQSRSDGFSAGILPVVGLLILGGIVVLFRLTGNDNRAVTDSDSGPNVPEYEPGQFTTMVDDPPPSNDVYRAWLAMVEWADANEGAGDTPAELAGRATAAGLPEAPVDELTELFCTVRYGSTFPTEDREERAWNALEEIRHASRSEASVDRRT